MKDKISIIIPIYNVEKFIHKCIQSVLNQTYMNVEIIMVDDGSTDKSGIIADEYAAKYNNMKVIHQENRGLSGARNTGIKASKGKYIGFVDSDDFIEPYMFERLVNILKNSDSDMAICNYDLVDASGTVMVAEEIVENEIFNRDNAFAKLCMDKNFYYITAVNKLYKREFLEKIAFPLGKYHEDEFTAHLFLNECEKIVSTSERLYHYVQRSNSITSVKGSINRLDSMYALLERSDFFHSLKYNEYALYSLKQAYSILFNMIDETSIRNNKLALINAYKFILKKLKFSPRTVKLTMKLAFYLMKRRKI